MAATTPARRILVAVDFSSRSHRLLRYAVTLARATNGEVEVLHVVPGPAAHVPSDVKWETLAASTVRQMMASARLSPTSPVHVRRGEIAREILDTACTGGFDLLLVSARVRAGWNGSFLGGTAAAIVRHARVPVLIVPAARQRAAASRKEAS